MKVTLRYAPLLRCGSGPSLSFLLFYLGILFLCVAVPLILKGQTRLSYQTQVRDKPAILVVERSLCTLPPTPQVSCVGFELYQFRMSDGSVVGPMLAMPSWPAITNANIWTPQPPLQVVDPYATGVPLSQIK